MREKLKNEIMLLLDKNVNVETLRNLEPYIDMILSNYDIEKRITDVIVYGSDIPETVEMYIVSKKIAGLSMKSLYLYTIVLIDFFRTIQKKPEKLFQAIYVYIYLNIKKNIIYLIVH